MRGHDGARATFVTDSGSGSQDECVSNTPSINTWMIHAGVGCRVWGVGCRQWGEGCGMQVAGFGVSGLGCRM